ncbi:MAG: hypothetical protein Q8907_04675 [Bacteroidota bacterium]|nr:hypothetical protein [Bacteroidota bacterium]MDP4226944.1 hypothetical protein [Bacteroidota bacterium]MDP4273555.1 hypothetical protein [Bacteroidota bacterium]
MQKIKTRTIFTSLVNNNGSMDNEYKNSFERFDENGNLIEEIVYTNEGNVESRNQYDFDEKGRMVREVNYIDEEEIGDVKNYILDAEGKITGKDIEYADGSKSFERTQRSSTSTTTTFTDEDGEFDGKEERKLDGNGNVIEFIRYGFNKNMEQHIVYEYNDDSKLTGSVEYEGEYILRKTEYQYDENGNQTLEVARTRKGELISRRVRKYDEKNHLIELSAPHFMIRYDYDEKGNMIREENVLSNGTLQNLTLYTYNEDNLLIEERIYRAGEEYSVGGELMAHEESEHLSKKYAYEFF